MSLRSRGPPRILFLRWWCRTSSDFPCLLNICSDVNAAPALSSPRRSALRQVETSVCGSILHRASHMVPGLPASLYSCNDVAFLNKQTPSCRPLALILRKPSSRDSPFTMPPGCLTTPQPSMAILGSAGASRPGGIRHAKTRAPPGRAGGFQCTHGRICGNNHKGIIRSRNHPPWYRYSSSVVGPPP